MKIKNENALSYGFMELGIPFTYRVIFNMKNIVDGEILQEALTKTEKRYPYFSVRMRKGDGEYFYEANPAPIVLLNTDEQTTLNSAQTNYHIWAVCYKDNTIFFDFYHGMADGGGSMRVITTLLYYYCNIRYGVTDKKGILTAEDEILAEETLDPLDNLPQQDISEINFCDKEKAFSMLKDGGEVGDFPINYEIILAENAFIKFTSANDSSPGTMILILLNRAIDARYPQREKPVITKYDINCRRALKSPHSFQNCLNFATFTYTDRMKKFPLTTQATIYRGITFLAGDDEVIVQNMITLSAVIKNTLKTNPTLTEKKLAFAKIIRENFANRTAAVSYVGKWQFPAVGDYIDSSFVHVAPHGAVMIEVTAINGKICLSFLQDFSDSGLFENFLSQLKTYEIKYEVIRKIKPDMPKFFEPDQ